MCTFVTTYDGKQTGAPERRTRHPAVVAGGLCFYLFHRRRGRHHHEHEVTVGGRAGGSRPSGATHTCPIPYVRRPRHKPGTHVRFNGVPKLWIRLTIRFFLYIYNMHVPKSAYIVYVDIGIGKVAIYFH